MTLELQPGQCLVLNGAGSSSLHQKQLDGSSCRVGVSLLCEIDLAKIWGSLGSIQGHTTSWKPHPNLLYPLAHPGTLSLGEAPS